MRLRMTKSQMMSVAQVRGLAAISKSDFRKMLADHPDIAFSLIRDLTGRIRVLSTNVKNLALLDVYGRVATTLLSLARERDGRLIVEERLTQQDIADRVGASREMVSRIMKDLVVGNYISIQRKRIEIHEKLPERY